MCVAVAALFAMAGVACGGDGVMPVGGDAGDLGDAGADFDGGLPSPLPEPVFRTTPYAGFDDCPDGWEPRRTLEDVAYCEPFPAGDLECPEGMFLTPGSSECERIGTACPEDGERFARVPEDVPSDAVVLHWDVAAAPGGDGSRDSPLGADPTVALLDGRSAVVMLASGDLELVNAELPVGEPGLGLREVGMPEDALKIFETDDVRFVGACVSGTSLIHPDRLAGALTLENLELRRSRIGFAVVAGSLRARNVLIPAGLTLQPTVLWGEPSVGTSVELSRALVHGPLAVRGIGHLQFASSVFHENITLDRGVHAQVERVVFRGSESRDDSVGASSALSIDGATFVGRNVVLGRGVGNGLEVTDGSEATLSDAVVRGRRTSPTSPSIAGIMIDRDASVTLVRVLVEDLDGDGVRVGRGVTVDARDVVVRGIRAIDGIPGSGLGLAAQRPERVALDGLAILNVATGGVRLSSRSAGSPSEVIGSRIRVVGATPLAPCGRAVELSRGAVRLTLDDVVIEGTYALGLATFALTVEYPMTVRGLSIVMQPGLLECVDPSVALLVASDAEAQVTDFLLYGARDCGYAVLDSGRLALEDGDIVGRRFGGCFNEGGIDTDDLTGPTVRYAGHHRELELWRDVRVPVPSRE